MSITAGSRLVERLKLTLLYLQRTDADLHEALIHVKHAAALEKDIQSGTGTDIFPDEEAYDVVEALNEVERVLDIQRENIARLIGAAKEHIGLDI